MRGHSSSPPGYTNQPTTPQREPYSTFSYFPLLMILVKVVVFSIKISSTPPMTLFHQSLPTGVPDDRLKLRVTIDQKYQQVSFSEEIIKRKEKLASAVKLSTLGNRVGGKGCPSAHSSSLRQPRFHYFVSSQRFGRGGSPCHSSYG